MSLFKQLWLAVFLVITLCLFGSFIITVKYGKNYIQNQLSQQNADAATRLALAIGSGDYSEVKAELQIASLFDSGNYQSIRLQAADGSLIVARQNDSINIRSPGWFESWVGLQADMGVAQVSNGWRQIGQLQVTSNLQVAYQLLWRNSITLSFYFILLGLMSGAVAHYFLLRLLVPLKAVIAQANALAERRFVINPAPQTPEFRQLVESMNILTQQVQTFFERDSKRLTNQQAELQLDSITGLYSRGAFIARMNSILTRDDESATGLLLLLRITDLHELNALYGRDKLDQFLTLMGGLVRDHQGYYVDALSGRLDGADIGLLWPGVHEKEEVAQIILARMQQLLDEQGLPNHIVQGVTTHCAFGETFEVLYRRLDDGLRDGFKGGSTAELVHIEPDKHIVPQQLSVWSTLFERGFNHNQFELLLFPVLDRYHTLLHWEAPVRLQLADQEGYSAGQFLPWIKRLNLVQKLDQEVLSLAIKHLQRYPQEPELGLNLSVQLLMDLPFQSAFLRQLEAAEQCASRLWFEMPESAVYHYLPEFKLLAAQLKRLGCVLGLEHAGHHVEKLGKLHDVGLDFIKIDSSIIRDIHRDPASQLFVQGVVTICHSIGMKIIAEGVLSEGEQNCLWQLGFDGVTGPFIRMTK